MWALFVLACVWAYTSALEFGVREKLEVRDVVEIEIEEDGQVMMQKESC